MDIRKADSKGRMTGFHPGRHYRVMQSGSYFRADVLDILDDVINPHVMEATPKEAQNYLLQFGIDPDDVARENLRREGYGEVIRDENGRKVRDYGAFRVERKPWPEGFDWEEFVSLVTGE